ncbi:RagB/SusD family nutrient uptake outer membrane protein [Carboxylicivirga mesophila]|uniref:RagB/SusD family nutrient uptake outer membrane protein n=1 Tax=Carboxylicivirga mesophila TaxID=1166478 RepID=A0ABS5K8T4_9BACT|nr:RagB/SusD family nutrient uptake outer membrane protein [Carboxylicivirga mesophila]MBS2211376.1 RagB/SusD family nutrient uptake outer membrane protein [Carboxylicivirga mesophila]
MKIINNYIAKTLALVLMTFAVASCHDLLDEPLENRVPASDVDYTIAQDMILPLYGAYAEFYNGRGWEGIPLLSVRGDDVNAGGYGDQQPFFMTDRYVYDNNYWMYNSLWKVEYTTIFRMFDAVEQIGLYREHSGNPNADQYIAETMVMKGWLLRNLALTWGDIIIPESGSPEDMLVGEVSTYNEVMQYISDLMDEALPYLPDMLPGDRSDVPGGITKYTALAIKAMVNLEMKNFQTVADATSEIIKSRKFALYSDFYELFKKDGELSSENLLELQFSDYGESTGPAETYLYAFYGTQNWTPKVEGAKSGWGFYEPSLKWVKFMLDRGETSRLQTSVLFTNNGINKITEDPGYADLPAWISNTTPSGDIINDYARAIFGSGKHYLPSDQLTSGRTNYGTGKNYTLLRYAEILLIHAEALVQGATSSTMSADMAVNEVRRRAGLNDISGVGLQEVLDEKFAELAMECGSRYYDMVRYAKYDELSYGDRYDESDGVRQFTADKVFLPYPLAQLDQLPNLREYANTK